ncbi:MAG: HNH endonuclease [Pseudobutyrivibrio sp.]|nr:HNH endonuclease [Pseudobutyrivibrio sp.]
MAKPELKWFYNGSEWRHPVTGARIRALMRDHFTCQLCGTRATEVHHLTELTVDNVKDKNISLNLDNLQSLCSDCHKKITKEEHNLIKNDCDSEYFFDENGFLQRRPSPVVNKSDRARETE